MTRLRANSRFRVLPAASTPARALALLLGASLVLVTPAPEVRAQSTPTASDWAAGAPVDTTGLGSGPYADMGMLYERTFLKVDVLQLSLRFGTETADHLERLVTGRKYETELAGSVTSRALEALDVLVRSRFLRNISLEQFLDGVRDNLRDAQNAGFLTAEEQQRIVTGIETWYEPLRARGIRSGEMVWYRIRGDLLHVAFQALDGSVTMERHFEGSEHRRAVLGGYLAPDSDFRAGLIRSLFRAPAD